jgi:RNA polymerase sigma-70 factor (ECF subfamily)
VQQTFYVWATKGSQLRDASKAKTWLFTTLHREFLKTRRKQVRFPEQALDQVEDELPAVDSLLLAKMDAKMDSKMILDALQQVDERYRVPISLFYLEDHSYKEIAEILDIAVGTIQSRIFRGKAQMQKLLADSFTTESIR